MTKLVWRTSLPTWLNDIPTGSLRELTKAPKSSTKTGERRSLALRFTPASATWTVLPSTEMVSGMVISDSNTSTSPRRMSTCPPSAPQISAAFDKTSSSTVRKSPGFALMRRSTSLVAVCSSRAAASSATSSALVIRDGVTGLLRRLGIRARTFADDSLTQQTTLALGAP